MATIVEIECSPRERGNSSAIVDAFSDGAMGLSTNIIDLFRIDHFRYINGCRGCRDCNRTGKCVQVDDVSYILEKIRDADVLVVSTPVYFGGPSSQWKTIEDRMFSFLDENQKTRLAPGKKAVVIVTCSGKISVADQVAALISRNLEFMGFEIESTLTFSDEHGSKSAANDTEILAIAKGVGARFRNT